MGLACGSFASRHTGGKAVVVAADKLTFTGRDGGRRRAQHLCRIEAAGPTSMTLEAHAVARERDGAQEFEVATGEFTFVALDEHDKPREIAAKEESNG
jgi:acyl-CoA thioesterase YciA